MLEIYKVFVIYLYIYIYIPKKKIPKLKKKSVPGWVCLSYQHLPALPLRLYSLPPSWGSPNSPSGWGPTSTYLPSPYDPTCVIMWPRKTGRDAAFTGDPSRCWLLAVETMHKWYGRPAPQGLSGVRWSLQCKMSYSTVCLSAQDILQHNKSFENNVLL